MEEIKLQNLEEYLIAASGSLIGQAGSPIIQSLKLKRLWGSFRVEDGILFIFLMDGKLIVFSGRSAQYLDAIGLHLSLIHTGNLYDMVHQKLIKIGNIASKSLWYKCGNHGTPASLEAPKPLGQTPFCHTWCLYASHHV